MKEHQKYPVESHFVKCGVAVTIDNIAMIIASVKSIWLT
jgi:hypothetical protein